MRLALTVLALNVAEIFAIVATVTGVVVMAKVWNVAPPGTSTVAGTAAVRLLLASVTVTPAPGAGAFKETLPVTVLPPATEEGDKETDVGCSAVTLRVPLVTVSPL